MKPEQTVIAVILAGGEGRRFGGVDKSFVSLSGKPLLAHVIERIAPQVTGVMLNAGGDPERFRAFGLPVLADRPQTTPATGPLLGLTSAFAALAQAGDATSAVLSVPVDTPFLPSDLVARLAAALARSTAGVAYAATTTRDHPIIALWTAQARDPLSALFAQCPEISLHGVMERMRGERVAFAMDAPIDAFFNINGPQDLQAAEQVASRPD